MLALVRLLQLSSPALPVGAYTYSQGLEWAVEQGVVSNEAGTLRWLRDALRWNVASLEAPMMAAMLSAWRDGRDHDVAALNADFLATREAAELRFETVQMGYSLVRLLTDLHAFSGLDNWKPRLLAMADPAYPAAWSAAAAAWQIPTQDALLAYLWAWLENQVMAAVKAVPLGQTAGQRLLAELGAELPALVSSITSDEQHWHNFTPGLALASCRHETQYTRLFRS